MHIKTKQELIRKIRVPRIKRISDIRRIYDIKLMTINAAI